MNNEILRKFANLLMNERGDLYYEGNKIMTLLGHSSVSQIFKKITHYYDRRKENRFMIRNEMGHQGGGLFWGTHSIANHPNYHNSL